MLPLRSLRRFGCLMTYLYNLVSGVYGLSSGRIFLFALIDTVVVASCVLHSVYNIDSKEIKDLNHISG